MDRFWLEFSAAIPRLRQAESDDGIERLGSPEGGVQNLSHICSGRLRFQMAAARRSVHNHVALAQSVSAMYRGLAAAKSRHD